MPKATKKIEVEVKEESPKKTATSKFLLIPLIILIVLGALAAAGYFYMKYQSTQNMVAGAQSTEELDQIVKKVAKLIEVPEDEQATLATVSDVTKLNGQPFFKNAQNGDKVLIYEQSKKAILYRPETNKIIEVGPVNIDQPKEASQSQVQNLKVRVALYNGTTTTGLTRRAEGQLLALSSLQVEVVAKENAKSTEYAESVVIDLTGKNSQAAQQLANGVKGKVGTLPNGEVKPENTDILVILGKSYTE